MQKKVEDLKIKIDKIEKQFLNDLKLVNYDHFCKKLNFQVAKTSPDSSQGNNSDSDVSKKFAYDHNHIPEFEVDDFDYNEYRYSLASNSRYRIVVLLGEF